jgi:hypothetical protein
VGYAHVRSYLKAAGLIRDGTCPLCHKQSQTVFHVLNNCETALRLGRYTDRHNAVLKLIVEQIKSGLPDTIVWCDLEGYSDTQCHPAWRPLLANARPDIVIWHSDDKMSLVELTCPFELFNEKHSCEAASERKRRKYAPFIDAVEQTANVKIQLFCVEVGSRGYVASSMLTIKHLLGLPKKQLRHFLVQLGRTAFLQSLNILKLRDVKHPDLLHMDP